MKAYLRSARIAPKKANIVAKMVRGMPVPAAMQSLQRTHKKAARLIEKLLQSAIANAEHNDKQDAHVLVVKSIVVNQGTAYHRGTPMARGRTRPMKKFLSHITLTLGIADTEEEQGKMKKRDRGSGIRDQEKEKKAAGAKGTASQKRRNPVKTSGSASNDDAESSTTSSAS